MESAEESVTDTRGYLAIRIRRRAQQLILAIQESISRDVQPYFNDLGTLADSKGKPNGGSRLLRALV